MQAKFINPLTNTHQEINKYEQSLKTYRDLHNTLETATQDGFHQGMEQGLQMGLEKGKYEQAISTAKHLKRLNLSNHDIAQATGLGIEIINQLPQENP